MQSGAHGKIWTCTLSNNLNIICRHNFHERYIANDYSLSNNILQLQTTISFKTVVTNLGYKYPQGYICLSEGVHLRLAIEEQNIFAYNFFQRFIHTSVHIPFNYRYVLIVKCIYDNHDKMFCRKKFQGYMFICRNAEGLWVWYHAFLRHKSRNNTNPARGNTITS